MAFKGQELPKEIKDEAEEWKQGIEEAKETGMGLASFLGGFMLPGGLGFTNPPGSKVTPTTVSARASRKLIYEYMKSLIPGKQEGILSGIKRTLSNLTKEESDILLSRTRAVKAYADRVRDITAIPDELMARVKNVEPVKKYRGFWAESENKLGLPTNLDKLAIQHEVAGHGATGWGKQRMVDILKDPAKRKQFENLSKESQDFIKGLTTLENFDYANLTRPFRSQKALDEATNFYTSNYTKWPGEVFSHSVEGAVPRSNKIAGPDLTDEAKRLGRRLSMYDYRKVAESKVKLGLKSMAENFPDKYKYHIEQVEDILK